jgi:3-isopropylmalate dehydrogenase
MYASRRVIAFVPGDGVGKEIASYARQLADFLRHERGVALDLWELDLGADRYLSDGATLPREIHTRLMTEVDAVIVCALGGDPRVENAAYGRAILSPIRSGMELYAQIRRVRPLHDKVVPLKAYSASDIDVTIVRESSEGAYSRVGGALRQGTLDEIAILEDINTRRGVERLVRAGFDFARAHGKRRVTLADKSCTMGAAQELWFRTFFEVAREYPEIQADEMLVDLVAMNLVLDPTRFEVIVTCNLFGDILGDVAAALEGGAMMGTSTSTHGTAGRIALFEPIHGPLHEIAGEDVVNPFGALLTVAAAVEHFGRADAADAVRAAITHAVAEGRCTSDLGGDLGTRAAAEYVLYRLAAHS